MISDWSRNCCHAFCYQCIGGYIQTEIRQKRIPICLSANCYEELSPQSLQLTSMNKNCKKIFVDALTLIYKRDNRFLCTCCGIWHNHKNKQQFVWSNCKHQYCDECTLRIINGSLSTLNQIPTCVYPKCNQSLSIKDADTMNRGFLAKYQLSNKCTKYLKYATKIDCRDCKSCGYHLVNCQECDGGGWYLIYCNKCRATGIHEYSIECSKCDGSGDYITRAQCNGCHGSGIYTPGPCRKCNGTGNIARYELNRTCSGCNGTGKYRMTCKRCKGSGIYRNQKDCWPCNGKGKIKKKVKCTKCKGSGKYRTNCDDCNAKGKVKRRCWTCGGDKQKMALDFHKLCSKQLLCGKCNSYFPNNMIFYWSNCSHTFCYQCTSKNVRKELNNNRHPICLQSECYQLLKIQQLGLIENKYCTKLKTIISLNNTFICNKCLMMLSPEKEFVWRSKCNHKYCNHCASTIINQSLSILNETPKCIVSECNQPLMFQHADAISNTLLTKYRNHKHHKKGVWYNQCREYLIHGYIRRISKYAPIELIVLIFDYYILEYFTKSNCYQCKSVGYQLFDCQQCHGIGYKTHCKQCTEKIHCCACDGKGKLKQQCKNCNGYKQKMVLDFNKLCHRQSLCSKCNKYFPNDMIFYWTNCHHAFCYQCILSYIKNRINNNQLPICLLSKCKQYLAIKQLKLINGNQSKHCNELKLSISWDNSSNGLYCNKLKRLICENNRFKCNKCHKMTLPDYEFLWTKCKHKYCNQCVPKIMNQSLSILNEIPKCIVTDCNQLLNIQDGYLITNQLLPKYKTDTVNVTGYNRAECLIFGYIRSAVNKYVPNDIISSISDYINLIYETKINCSECKSRLCQKCNGYGYPADYTQCERTGTYYLENPYCSNCGGRGKIKVSRCIHCNGHKQITALNFNKLCNKQSLCGKCNNYFPNDMIFYWTNCHHTFCYHCISQYIQKKLNNNQMPICVISKCNQPLAMKQFELINMKSSKYCNELRVLISENNRFKCNKCHKMTLPEQEFLWTKCKHKYCNKCAPKIINQSLSVNRTPRCVVSECNQLLDVRDCDILKDSLLKRYKIDSLEMKGFYDEHKISTTINCYNCNSTGQTLVDCTTCQCFGYIEDSKHAMYDVYKCRGSAYNLKKCRDCNGSGKVTYICYKCGGIQRIIILDFNKLFCHQSLCVNCNQYVPNNMVKYWSRSRLNCHHIFCDKCLVVYIEDEINHNRIPLCSSSNCCQELTVQRLRFISIENQQTLIKKLETLIYRKNRFKCTFCGIWHKNEEKFSWSICKHQYGTICVKSYVDKTLPKEDSVLNVFKVERVPSCYDKHCSEKLKLAEASEIVTEYQHKTLKKLIDKADKAKQKKKAEDCIVMARKKLPGVVD